MPLLEPHVRGGGDDPGGGLQQVEQLDRGLARRRVHRLHAALGLRQPHAVRVIQPRGAAVLDAQDVVCEGGEGGVHDELPALVTELHAVVVPPARLARVQSLEPRPRERLAAALDQHDHVVQRQAGEDQRRSGCVRRERRPRSAASHQHAAYRLGEEGDDQRRLDCLRAEAHPAAEGQGGGNAADSFSLHSLLTY